MGLDSVRIGCKEENHHNNKKMFPPSSTETKIALLEERINVYEQMMERIDTAIQKIGETSQNISQMLAVHNEKIEQCNRTDNLIVSMIEDIKKSSKEQHEQISKELGERIDRVEEKVLDIARNLMEENKEAFQHLAAIERKELAEKDFEDLTREQRIQLALEEIDWIVIGGQDGEEFYGSIQFLRKVLRSLV